MVDADVPDETLPPKEKDSVSPQSADRILESETTTSYSYIYASGKLLQEKVTTNGTTETHNSSTITPVNLTLCRSMEPPTIM